MDKPPIHGKSARLADLVGYQDGSIVSKILVKGKNGSVTVFAFDEAQELSEHTVPFDALVYVFDGAAEIRIAEETHCLQTGEAMVMPANEPHALKATRRFKMMLSMIKG
jgi:quercetin dioxygenase-like cupin family protein